MERALTLTQEINGAPRTVFQCDEAAQAQGLIAGADQLAETANKAIPALRDGNDPLDRSGLVGMGAGHLSLMAICG